ncbi:XRE family transcriptional regulator [Halomonas sp. BMC6]|uniref:LexA family protein n=1 Tax=Halomonas sp. BMC6 TaxID=3073244 RepID=UPI0030D5B4F8
MLSTHPVGNSPLVDVESLCGLVLPAKMANKAFEYGVHRSPSYANAHRIDHAQTHLQRYEGAHNNSGMELKDRIRLARKQAKLSQVQAAEKAGIDQATISNLERGRHHSSTHLLKIADALGVSYRWLTTGLGDMHGVEDERASYIINTSPTAQPIRHYKYPVVSGVQAGKFGECVVPYPSGMEERHEITDYAAKGSAFWLEVTGDSMTAPPGVSPSIPEGSLVLVDTGIEPTPGRLVVAQLDESNEATFKKLIIDGGQKYLKALNPAYPLIPINGNCRIIGVAVKSQMTL